MKIIQDGTITDVPGFLAAGIASGVRRKQRKDLALIYSIKPAVAAAVFTQNKIKAAPVLLDLEHIHSPSTRAIIVNSGNANACTGEQGMENAKRMVEYVAAGLGLKPHEVLIESTGVIGVPLDMSKIEAALPQVITQLSTRGGHDAASAIQTTDTISKQICVEVILGNTPVRIAGIAKGSGMIHPNMATMLAFITTDVNIDKSLLQTLFSMTVDETYNMISVDGDTSTNDAAMILANGEAKNNKLVDIDHPESQLFLQALLHVNKYLAIKIAEDGEGASKLIEVQVKQAPSLLVARHIAKSVIKSNLFKTAMFGADANWGRILCAVGYSSSDFNPYNIDIYLADHQQQLQVAQGSMGKKFDEQQANRLLASTYIKIIIDLNDGQEQGTAWGCDLSYDYIKINADYRS